MQVSQGQHSFIRPFMHYTTYMPESLPIFVEYCILDLCFFVNYVTFVGLNTSLAVSPIRSLCQVCNGWYFSSVESVLNISFLIIVQNI